MQNTKCPRCGELTITTIDKMRAGHWYNLYCSHCNARLVAQPFVLAAIYFLVTWDIVLFGFLTWYDSNWKYFVTMIVIWLIIEYFLYYVPLVVLKPKKLDE